MNKTSKQIVEKQFFKIKDKSFTFQSGERLDEITIATTIKHSALSMVRHSEYKSSDP